MLKITLLTVAFLAAGPAVLAQQPGDGVRMPAYQMAQAQPVEALAPAAVQQAAPQAPAEVAPKRARKQDRN